MSQEQLSHFKTLWGSWKEHPYSKLVEGAHDARLNMTIGQMQALNLTNPNAANVALALVARLQAVAACRQFDPQTLLMTNGEWLQDKPEEKVNDGQ